MPDLPFHTCERWQKQTVFVEGFTPVEITRSFSWSENGLGWSYAGNQLLICPRCQRKWAYLDFGEPISYAEPPACLWPVPAFCDRCEGDGKAPAGTLFPDKLDLPLLWSLPEELLQRELQLHLNHMNKEMKDG